MDITINQHHIAILEAYSSGLINNSRDIFTGSGIAWPSLSECKNLTMDIVENFIDSTGNSYWIWHWLADNPNLSEDIIKKYSDKIENWEYVTRNISSIEIIDKYPYPPRLWNWKTISGRKDLTTEFIEKHMDIPQGPDNTWDWARICYNKNITIDFIKKYQDKNWPWERVFERFGLDEELFLKNSDKITELWHLSNNSFITIELIEKYYSKISLNFYYDHTSRWDWEIIFKRTTTPLEELIKKYDKPLNKEWFWRAISEHPKISPEILNRYTEKPFAWSVLALQPNTTILVFNKYMDKFFEDLDSARWVLCYDIDKLYMESIEKIFDALNKRNRLDMINWRTISRNQNLTSKFIIKYKYKPWNYAELFLNNKFNRYNSAVIIQRWYRKYGAFPRWKKRIRDIHMPILYSPKIPGIKFLEELEVVEREYERNS